ncbi:hypothetical protein ALC56_09001, partial [Trachymyrmex septentrionalis]
ADLLFLFTASVSIGRPEKTVGTGHGVDDSSTTRRYPLNFFPLRHRIVNIITVRRGGNLDRLTAVMLEMVELKETDWPPRRFTEEPLNRDNAFIIAALSFILYAKTIETFTVDQKPSRRHISRSLIDQMIGISILMRGQFRELLDSFYHSSGCRFPSPLPPSWYGRVELHDVDNDITRISLANVLSCSCPVKSLIRLKMLAGIGKILVEFVLFSFRHCLSARSNKSLRVTVQRPQVSANTSCSVSTIVCRTKWGIQSGCDDGLHDGRTGGQHDAPTAWRSYLSQSVSLSRVLRTSLIKTEDRQPRMFQKYLQNGMGETMVLATRKA